MFYCPPIRFLFFNSIQRRWDRIDNLLHKPQFITYEKETGKLTSRNYRTEWRTNWAELHNSETPSSKPFVTNTLQITKTKLLTVYWCNPSSKYQMKNIYWPKTSNPPEQTPWKTKENKTSRRSMKLQTTSWTPLLYLKTFISLDKKVVHGPKKSPVSLTENTVPWTIALASVRTIITITKWIETNFLISGN